MSATPTFRQLVEAVATAPSFDDSYGPFQHLHAEFIEHFFKAYCSRVYNSFQLTWNVIAVVDAYDTILRKTRKDIHSGRFNPNRYPDDAALRKGLISWMLAKVEYEVKNALRKRKRTRCSVDQVPMERVGSATHATALARVPGEDPEFTAEVNRAIEYAVGRLTEKERDLLKWDMCGYALLDDVTAELMRTYGIPTASAFERACRRMRARYRVLIAEYSDEKSSTNHISTNLCQHEEKEQEYS